MAKVKLVNSKYQHAKVVAKQSGLKVRTKPIIKPETLIKKVQANEPIGYIIGITDSPLFGYYWYALIPAFATSDKVVWVAAKYVKPVSTKQPTRAETESMINELVNNDKVIYQRLIVLGAMIRRLEARGKKLPKLTAHYNRLVRNLTRRQIKLQSSNWVKTKQWIDNEWEKLKQKFGLGIAPIVAAVAGGVVAIVATVTLYYMFKPDYDESKKDLKITESLKKALDSLPENERKAVEQDLEKQIDKAYNAGKTAGAFSSLWSVGKYAAIATAGFVFIPRLLESANKHRR